MPISRSRAVTVIAAGAVLLGVLLVGQDAHLEHATLKPAPPPSMATELTKTTRTTYIMTDDETVVRKLAERYVKAVNDNDNTTIAELNCAKAAPGLLQIAAAGQPVTMGDGLERASTEDRYYVDLMVADRPGPRMVINKRDGTWCVFD